MIEITLKPRLSVQTLELHDNGNICIVLDSAIEHSNLSDAINATMQQYNNALLATGLSEQAASIKTDAFYNTALNSLFLDTLS